MSEVLLPYPTDFAAAVAWREALSESSRGR
jgi:hypothetical protein